MYFWTVPQQMVSKIERLKYIIFICFICKWRNFAWWKFFLYDTLPKLQQNLQHHFLALAAVKINFAWRIFRKPKRHHAQTVGSITTRFAAMAIKRHVAVHNCRSLRLGILSSPQRIWLFIEIINVNKIQCWI